MNSYSKLVLGTAQFGLTYGVNNFSGKVDEIEILKILDFANEIKINFLDTANLYGDAQKIIGKLNDNRFNIISKFPHVCSIENLKKEFDSTTSELKLNNIYAYLSHNPNDLINNPEIWNQLSEYRKIKKIEKIGVSLYNTHELDELLKMNIIPDIVQLPYSLLDRKFEPYFDKLKSLSVDIHVRSVFLQGLYFKDLNFLPKKIIKLKPYLLKLNDICNQFDVDINLLALNFVYFNTFIDNIIIGIDNLSQLKINCNLINQGCLKPIIISEINNIFIREKELLNPSNW